MILLWERHQHSSLRLQPKFHKSMKGNNSCASGDEAVTFSFNQLILKFIFGMDFETSLDVQHQFEWGLKIRWPRKFRSIDDIGLVPVELVKSLMTSCCFSLSETYKIVEERNCRSRMHKESPLQVFTNCVVFPTTRPCVFTRRRLKTNKSFSV